MIHSCGYDKKKNIVGNLLISENTLKSQEKGFSLLTQHIL